MGTEYGNKNFNEPDNTQQEQIRCMISAIYDLQKVRIAIGNRVVQSFYISLGIKPGEKKEIKSANNETDKEKEEKKRKKDLLLMRKEYKRVSDYVAENNKRVQTAIKNINASKDEQALKWIRSESDYRLIDSYSRILVAEEEATKAIEPYVLAHPLWDAFFKDVRGCGTLMSAVCLAYLNPYKARHVSSFYKYCGIDAVTETDENGNVLYWDKNRSRKLREKVRYVTEYGDEHTLQNVTATGRFTPEGYEIFEVISTGESCRKEVEERCSGEDAEGNPIYDTVYEDIETGAEYVGDVIKVEHGRRKGDTEMYEYKAKDGSIKLKRGLTYNPVVKEKLMGVLADCLIRSGESKYALMYYDYKSRLNNSSYHQGKAKAHKHLMAKRFMIRNFLRDLWVTWRKLEGLPVDLPYEVAKLGNEPHAYNAYQCEVARKSLGLTNMVGEKGTE